MNAFCPNCGAKEKSRERRPLGNSTCEKGHSYPSYTAMNTSNGYVCECGKLGSPKTEGGFPCGIFCDDCFGKMVTTCRSRSW